MSARQIGEAVAWRWHHRNAPGNWRYQEQTFAQVKGMGPVSDYVFQPLIPASDLATITRERDEAVRLLRGYVADYPPFELDHMAEAFLTSLPATPQP